MGRRWELGAVCRMVSEVMPGTCGGGNSHAESSIYGTAVQVSCVRKTSDK